MIAKSSDIYFKDKMISQDCNRHVTEKSKKTGALSNLRNDCITHPYHGCNLDYINIRHKTLYLYPIAKITGVSFFDCSRGFRYFCGQKQQ